MHFDLLHHHQQDSMKMYMKYCMNTHQAAIPRLIYLSRAKFRVKSLDQKDRFHQVADGTAVQYLVVGYRGSCVRHPRTGLLCRPPGAGRRSQSRLIRCRQLPTNDRNPTPSHKLIKRHAANQTNSKSYLLRNSQ